MSPALVQYKPAMVVVERIGGEYVLGLCQRKPHLGNLKPDNSLRFAPRGLRIDLAGYEPAPIDFAALSHMASKDSPVFRSRIKPWNRKLFRHLTAPSDEPKLRSSSRYVQEAR